MDIEHNVGRLTEVYAASPVADEEVAAFIEKTRKIYGGAAQKFVAIVDLRKLRILTPTQADQIIRMMQADNPHVERTGMLLPPTGSMLALQFERMVKEAGNPNRAVFNKASDVLAFLDPLLNDDEKRRLRDIVAAGPAEAV